jgi:hypothetical protein
MNNYNKSKRIVESYEDFIQNRNESLNEGVLDWGREIKEKVMNWLRNVNSQPKGLAPHNDPRMMHIANSIVGGAKVSDEDYRFFMEETGMIDKPNMNPKTLSDRYFDYDEMLELVLDNIRGWSASGGHGMFDFDVVLEFTIEWFDAIREWDYTRIIVDDNPPTLKDKMLPSPKRVKLKVRATEENIYRLDDSSPKSIFEYYSYGLDTYTLRRFCKDISEQAPEKQSKRRFLSK